MRESGEGAICCLVLSGKFKMLISRKKTVVRSCTGQPPESYTALMSSRSYRSLSWGSGSRSLRASLHLSYSPSFAVLVEKSCSFQPPWLHQGVSSRPRCRLYDHGSDMVFPRAGESPWPNDHCNNRIVDSSTEGRGKQMGGKRGPIPVRRSPFVLAQQAPLASTKITDAQIACDLRIYQKTAGELSTSILPSTNGLALYRLLHKAFLLSDSQSKDLSGQLSIASAARLDGQLPPLHRVHQYLKKCLEARNSPTLRSRATLQKKTFTSLSMTKYTTPRVLLTSIRTSHPRLDPPRSHCLSGCLPLCQLVPACQFDTGNRNFSFIAHHITRITPFEKESC